MGLNPLLSSYFRCEAYGGDVNTTFAFAPPMSRTHVAASRESPHTRRCGPSSYTSPARLNTGASGGGSSAPGSSPLMAPENTCAPGALGIRNGSPVRYDSSITPWPSSTTRTLHPRRAYLSGFLQPLVSNPYSGLLGIVHWSPSYGLAGNSKDDVALQTGQELDSGHAPGGRSKLEGMTFPARTQYIRELMSGYCAGEEQDLIIRLFETVPARERRALYQAVEGHAWTGDFKEGIFTRDDDLVDSLSRARLNRLRDVINAP